MNEMTEASGCNQTVSTAEVREFAKSRDAILQELHASGNKVSNKEVADTLETVIGYCSVQGSQPLTKAQFDYAKIHAPFAQDRIKELSVIDKNFKAIGYMGLNQDAGFRKEFATVSMTDFQYSAMTHAVVDRLRGMSNARPHREFADVEARIIESYKFKTAEIGMWIGAALGTPIAIYDWIKYPKPRLAFIGEMTAIGGGIGTLLGHPETIPVAAGFSAFWEPLAGAYFGGLIGRELGGTLARARAIPTLEALRQDMRVQRNDPRDASS